MTDIRLDRYQNILDQFGKLEHDISQAGNDPQLLASLLKERSQKQELANLAGEYIALSKQLQEVEESLEEEKDTEMYSVLQQEQQNLEERVLQLQQQIDWLLIPSDPDAGKNVFLEIRAGTGGDEAALFAADLFRMYSRYLDKNKDKFSWQLMSLTDTGLNGIKEAVLLIRGDKAYEYFHLEAGTHRVQRIPETESSGRIHTSACTVAVVPEAEEQELDLDDNDIRVDVYRASGAGGQHVNKTESAVRLTHIPSGVVVTCQDEKSQHKNKARAMSILRSRIVEAEKAKKHEARSAEKKAQVGSGDRSEKIRTYNFPQNRVTDHRIHFTGHNLDKVMEGDMDEVLNALIAKERELKLEDQKQKV